MFKIIKKDPQSWARAGVLKTPHGEVATPAYTVVATLGEVKCLPTNFFSAVKLQVVIANTYHLWQNHQGPHGGIDGLPSVHSLLKATLPIMTDSGGFQVFSLGFSREHGIGKVNNIFPRQTSLSANLGGQADLKRPLAPEKNLVRITEEGAFFTTTKGEEQFLGPELSIHIQEKLGADIILAFDECTSPLHSFAYTKEAMERTHRWAKICLQTRQNFAKQNLGGQTKTSSQLLYGIVQGGEFKELRQQSAQFIASLPFDGLAIGGSFGQDPNSDPFQVLKWTIPFLGEGRPRHFLGVGRTEDLFEGVERGIDTFDCVIPTREARHGRIWTAQGSYDITKGIYKLSAIPLEKDCLCPACLTTTQGELHTLFKSKNPLAGQWATAHNIFFFNNLMEQIRLAILENRFSAFKQNFLAGTRKNPFKK